MNVIELHGKVWQSLQQRRERLPHALLLAGQKGLGKFDLARQFAAALLCETPGGGGTACGQCLACNWFAQGNHPDFRLLQPEAMADDGETEEGKKKASQQITIDQVRGLDDFLSVGTHRGGLRIILVNPAEAMNRNTANALLKTLEEPAPDTLFLMLTNEPTRLLATIRSRCQLVPVPVPSSALASRVLADAGIRDADRWLALAGGSPILAVEMASGGQGAWLQAMIDKLAAGQRIDPLAAAADLEKTLKESKGKIALKHLVEVLQKWLVDLNLVKNGLPVRYFLPHQATIATLADSIPLARLIQFYRTALKQRQVVEQPLNPRLFLEGVFLDYRALFAKDRQ